MTRRARLGLLLAATATAAVGLGVAVADEPRATPRTWEPSRPAPAPVTEPYPGAWADCPSEGCSWRDLQRGKTARTP